jgi:hypothetical protein
LVYKQWLAEFWMTMHEVYNRKFYTIPTIVHKSEYEDCKGG